MDNSYVKLNIINYIYITVLEIIFRIFVMDIIDVSILNILIFSLPISVIITLIMTLTNKKYINKIISVIIWISICLIFCSETVYFSFYKTICGISALEYGGQVMEFFSAIMVHIKSNIMILISDIILTILLLIIMFKTNKFSRVKIKEFLLLFVPGLIMISSILGYKKNENSSNYYLFFKTNDLIESVNRFGLLTSINLDAVKYIVDFEESITIDNSIIRKFTMDSEKEYNIMNIDFDKLIKNESDSTIKSMHEYFSKSAATNQNEYTGIFAGKNLIFITAEGFSPIAVDKELTPTLYKLVNEGLYFSNYYQPIYNCSTSDGEFVNLLSLLPGVATCSMKSTSDTYLPYTIGNIFKNYGYETYAFHGWTYNYYNRDLTHPNMGFKYYGYDTYNNGYKNALKGITYSWPTSDIEVVNSSYNYYSKSDNFVAYYMSISGHLEYNFNNAIAKKNQSLVSNMNASNKIKAYMATQIEFDKSLEILLNNLERDGLLDDTVIVIAADHYPYGLSNSDISEYVDWMNNETFDLYKNNLVIYNTQLEHKEVNKYVGSIDVLPTLLNMFGVKYDSRLLMGTDIFSDSDDLVIFNNKSWITSKGRYDYPKKKIESFTDEEVSEEYINDINKIVQLKFQMSKLIISKNYYRKVFGD